jgi:hypothetical protein
MVTSTGIAKTCLLHVFGFALLTLGFASRQTVHWTVWWLLGASPYAAAQLRETGRAALSPEALAKGDRPDFAIKLLFALDGNCKNALTVRLACPPKPWRRRMNVVQIPKAHNHNKKGGYLPPFLLW